MRRQSTIGLALGICMLTATPMFGAADPPETLETGTIPSSGCASIGLRSTDSHLSAQARLARYS
jgi:hypothetical protein